MSAPESPQLLFATLVRQEMVDYAQRPAVQLNGIVQPPETFDTTTGEFLKYTFTQKPVTYAPGVYDYSGVTYTDTKLTMQETRYRDFESDQLALGGNISPAGVVYGAFRLVQGWRYSTTLKSAPSTLNRVAIAELYGLTEKFKQGPVLRVLTSSAVAGKFKLIKTSRDKQEQQFLEQVMVDLDYDNVIRILAALHHTAVREELEALKPPAVRRPEPPKPREN